VFDDILRDEVEEFVKKEGADLIGFANVERWDEFDEVPKEFRPKFLFDKTKTIIVMGVSMPLPIVDTTPSILHKETYDTANRFLDNLAYNLTRFLNRKGYASMFFTRDGFGSVKVLIEREPIASFSHTFAAKYAGLGTLSKSHNILTPEFGPRVRFVSVFTEAELRPSPMIEKTLCINCGMCAKCCPKKVLIPEDDENTYNIRHAVLKENLKRDAGYYKFDVIGCCKWAEELTRRRAYPCGVCTKVCPIGKDRELYGETNMANKYLREKELLESHIDHPDYKVWNHFRKYGSFSIKDGKIFE